MARYLFLMHAQRSQQHHAACEIAGLEDYDAHEALHSMVAVTKFIMQCSLFAAYLDSCNNRQPGNEGVEDNLSTSFDLELLHTSLIYQTDVMQSYAGIGKSCTTVSNSSCRRHAV